nr:immunoglobulin heavy chain junction region [Macaca mulatta]MPN83337.1 immunoglobulin heavy chain junction region [Macaca mulatta]MPN83386.1 immunoglobulin heavy chain junction region [Macaca mulatta]MPN83416.1 immunoglobulin heavy chain junction region [Macaca mulatta]MPN83543.1 immunoglobulin heavy chain junction region [Macaca mulatta]
CATMVPYFREYSYGTAYYFDDW